MNTSEERLSECRICGIHCVDTTEFLYRDHGGREVQPGGGYDGRLLCAFNPKLVAQHASRPHPKSKLFIFPPPRMAGQPDLSLLDLHFDP